MQENALSRLMAAFMPSAAEHCKSKVRPLGGANQHSQEPLAKLSGNFEWAAR
jgi:hypothetical protein